jgi:hypothetical protein
MANCAWVPASVEKIVPSALRLPPARVRHECRAAGEFQAGAVSGVLILPEWAWMTEQPLEELEWQRA